MSPNQIKCLVYQLFTVPMAKTKQKPSQILRQIQRATKKKKNKENIENGRREGASSMSRKSFSFYTRRPPTERKKAKAPASSRHAPFVSQALIVADKTSAKSKRSRHSCPTVSAL